MNHRTGIALIVTLLAVSACLGQGAEQPFARPRDVPDTGIGFRGDGTGVYPDANPPVEWDERTGRNILWKAELPNWGYASPVPVGNRVLMVTEPGYQINLLLAAKWTPQRRTKWTQQGFPKGFSYACQMNIAGDRIYICSQDFLYCIGRKDD